MSLAELEENFRWFVDSIPQRIEQLGSEVRSTVGFENWEADFTPASLDQLGSWFATQVETRERTATEIERRSRGVPLPESTQNWELTERTFSLAIDIAMYLGQLFITNHKNLEWELRLTRDIGYGQPTLPGFGKLSLNPVHLMITLAYGLARRSKTGQRLHELYDIWSAMLQPQADPDPLIGGVRGSAS